MATMAGQALCTESSSGGDDAHDLPLCLLQDLLGVAAFLARHPLHAVYVLFFARYIISLAVFFCPLLVSTSLLVAVLVTAAPYVSPEWTGVYSLGRTCGIVVDALCAEVRSDSSAGVELVGQICSFVLGDGAAIGEKIFSELCDISGSCFLFEEKILLLGTEDCCRLGVELPLQTLLTGEKIFLGHEKFGKIQHEIEDKIVVCEDLKEFKGSGSSSSQSYSSEAFVQKMEEEEDRVQNGSDAKRVECVPGSVEIMKCEHARLHSSVSGRIRQWEAHECRNFIQLPEETADNPFEFSLEKRSLKDIVQNGSDAKRVECVPGSVEIMKCEHVRSHSSVSGRIRQWEAHVCRNFIQLPEETADNPFKFSLEKRSLKEMEESIQLETKARDRKCSKIIQAQEIPIVQEPVQQLDTKTSSKKCSEVQAEELSDSIVQHQQEWKEQSQGVQAEPELQEQERKDVQHGQESQEQCHKDVQVEQDPQEQEYNYMEPEEELQDQEDKFTQPDPQEQEYKDADIESESLCDNARDASLKLTSIARCVHSRTSSGNLVSEGLPGKEKEWKRTLGCKLYEERMKLKVCREPAVIGCNDDMDILWETYEAAGSSHNARGGDVQEDFAVEGKNGEREDEDEGSVRQLCCLQALNFSTRKMNFAGGKPSLAKISKVLKRMTVLSRIRSRRDLDGLKVK